jgi:hypothetical protein
MKRSFVRTFSGAEVDLLHPTQESLRIEDIAHHLSKLDRYNGAGAYPYSVGQHCLLVAEVLPPLLKLWGLLHDATEAYLGDVVAPLKSLCSDYRFIEQNLMKHIACRFGLSLPRPSAIKTADKGIMVAEMHQVMNWPDLACRQEVEPAPVRIWQRPWQAVREEFLKRFREYGGASVC